MTHARLHYCLAVLMSFAFAPALAAQTRNATEVALGAVMHSPLGAGGSALVRVGIVQRDRTITARLAVETIVHGGADEQAPIATRGMAGVGYDLRVRPTRDGPITHLLAGAGLYRTVGVKADAHPAWLLAPRVGASLNSTFARAQLGAEIALQYVALSNFGAARGRAKRVFLPLVVTARF